MLKSIDKINSKSIYLNFVCFSSSASNYYLFLEHSASTILYSSRPLGPVVFVKKIRAHNDANLILRFTILLVKKERFQHPTNFLHLCYTIDRKRKKKWEKIILKIYWFSQKKPCKKETTERKIFYKFASTCCTKSSKVC